MKQWTLEEISEQKKSTEVVIQQIGSKREEWIVLLDIDDRVKKAWMRDTTDLSKYVEINVKEMVKRISEYLSKHVSLEKLLRDKLLHEPLETILDLDLRVEKKPKVKEHEGCFYIEVAGKQGKPLEVTL